MAISKATRLSDITDIVEAIDLSEFHSTIEEFSSTLEQAAEALEEVGSGATEALNHHEERDWESRNSALERVDEQVEEANDGLDRAEELFTQIQGEWVTRIAAAREAVAKIRTHTGQLIDF